MAAKIVAGIMFVATIFTSTVASANCNLIQNTDKKMLCYAIDNNNETKCNHINNNDNKWSCRAYVTQNPTKCNNIQNRDSKNLCYVMSGRK